MNPSTETSGITRRSLAETYEAQDLIIQAAQDAKREATKAYREQLDRVGMDKDAIKSEVEGFKLAYRRKVAVEKKGSDEVEHRDAIADEIFLEITSPAPRATRVATTVPDGFDPETGEEITEPQEAQAPAQAVPDDAPVASVPVESTAAEISTPIQPETATSFAGAEAHGVDAKTSDSNAVSTVPLTIDGNANTGGHDEVPAHPVSVIDPGRRQSEPASEVAHNGDEHQRTGRVETNEAPAGRVADESPASIIYPAPGVVVMETCPPEGALAHPYAACWPVRDIDVSEGVREPIVKIGKLILDGRGRMFAARGWDGGKGREYPVVQYDGTDPLMDCIRWNLASRPGIHAHNLNLIAGKLAKLEPTRADEIMQAFGLEVAEAAE